ncbi:MAG TPA: hypothetical protein PKZ84_18275 [Anaerolineae bacterium]|nr:hypothetical protein [Anaerolineae bacterium]HQI85623.1 hypothetical protein [Anaerolineae bacterium]
MKTQSDALIYEIRFKGHLGQNTLVWFEDFTVEYSSEGETILRGPIVDQAALRGILTRIFDLGLSLTLFRQLSKEPG